jgi:hypothetical protein
MAGGRTSLRRGGGIGDRISCTLGSIALACAMSLASARASADDGEKPTPFQLYQEGKSAYDAGDFAAASRLLARADEAQPNSSVLDLAMAAARRADDPVLGMELVERAEQRGLSAAAIAGRKVFASRVGLLVLACPDATRCEAVIDGASGTERRWLRVGEHAVVLKSEDNTEQFSIQVEAEKTMVVRPTRVVEMPPKPIVTTPGILSNPPPEIDKGERRDNLSRNWFWGGVAATSALTIATTVSGIDTLSTRSDFRSNPSNDELASQGHRSEGRTNVLLTGTLVAAATTAVLAYFVWRPAHHGN